MMNHVSDVMPIITTNLKFIKCEVHIYVVSYFAISLNPDVRTWPMIEKSLSMFVSPTDGTVINVNMISAIRKPGRQDVSQVPVVYDERSGMQLLCQLLFPSVIYNHRGE